MASRDLSGTADRRLPQHDSVSAQDKLLIPLSFQQKTIKRQNGYSADTTYAQLCKLPKWF